MSLPQSHPLLLPDNGLVPAEPHFAVERIVNWESEWGSGKFTMPRTPGAALVAVFARNNGTTPCFLYQRTNSNITARYEILPGEKLPLPLEDPEHIRFTQQSVTVSPIEAAEHVHIWSEQRARTPGYTGHPLRQSGYTSAMRANPGASEGESVRCFIQEQRATFSEGDTHSLQFHSHIITLEVRREGIEKASITLKGDGQNGYYNVDGVYATAVCEPGTNYCRMNLYELPHFGGVSEATLKVTGGSGPTHVRALSINLFKTIDNVGGHVFEVPAASDPL